MNYLIFGGDGFIGTHLSKYISELGVANKHIHNFDIKNEKNFYSAYTYLDVRQHVGINIPEVSNSVIFNLAAIHTTPGHPDYDYFATNISGAENVCKFARANGINTIVFTSSIAPYGASEDIKTEESLPLPKTPYGISKLIAEYIHKVWQAEDPGTRKLIIVRPGVVFGKNEGQNFTRLYNSLKRGFFFYPGRKSTIKAAVYVKDVVRVLYETSLYEAPGVTTLNLSYFPAPTIEKICDTIAQVTKVKQPKIVIPSFPLKFVAAIAYSSTKLLGKTIAGIHPERVGKLTISTNISAEKLSKTQYYLRYSLEDAIKDWFNDCNNEELS